MPRGVRNPNTPKPSAEELAAKKAQQITDRQAKAAAKSGGAIKLASDSTSAKAARASTFLRQVDARIKQLTARLTKVETENIDLKKKVRTLTIQLKNKDRELARFTNVIDSTISKSKTTRTDRALAVDETDYGAVLESSGNGAGTSSTGTPNLADDEEL